jgi:D-alanine transaminase
LIVYLNGQFLPAEEARVSVFDRGFLLGDAIYDGLRVQGGRIIALDRHINRTTLGLAQTHISGFDPARIEPITQELLERNRCRDAFIYWQISRGTPAPGHPVRGRTAEPGIEPTVFAYCEAVAGVETHTTPNLVRVSLAEDLRWSMGHIKATSLIGGVIAAMGAQAAGNSDAILCRDNLVSEATATNVIIAKDGAMATPDLESTSILEGATRALLLEAEPSIEQRPVTVDELRGADEIMILGTRTMLAAVSHIDGEPLGVAGETGSPGPIATKLLASLVAAILRDIDSQNG